MQATAPELAEIIEGVQSHRKALRIHNFTGDRSDLTAIREFFEPHDVDISAVSDDPARSTNEMVLSSNGTVLAASPLADVLRYARAWQDSTTVGLDTEPPEVFRRLHDNYFESTDKLRMVMASRIVEFRAWNVGSGELHAGFQQLSKLDNQHNVYRNLSNSDVDVHVYGAPDTELSSELDLTVHPGRSDEILDYWWVAFDGDGDDERKVVLLAEEREPNRFYGFWTYEATVVDDVLDRVSVLA